MFTVFLRGVNVLKLMTIKFNEYIELRGMTVVEDETLKKEPLIFIQKLLEIIIPPNP
jgi:hypothetical protein